MSFVSEFRVKSPTVNSVFSRTQFLWRLYAVDQLPTTMQLKGSGRRKSSIWPTTNEHRHGTQILYESIKLAHKADDCLQINA